MEIKNEILIKNFVETTSGPSFGASCRRARGGSASQFGLRDPETIQDDALVGGHCQIREFF